MKKTAIFLAACVLLCACNRSFTFIHMSDPQIGFIDASPGFGHTDTLMKKALNQALAQSPDLVINTGDLVNDPSSAVQDSIYTENLKALGTVPYWAVPGNHDILPYSRQNRELYLARRGYDHFSFRHKGWTFIGLDSNCIKNNDTAAEDAQLEWLVSELSSARKGRILVFFHHPVIKQDFDEPEEYFNFPSMSTFSGNTESRPYLPATRTALP